MADLRAPFPWFGGKSKVANLVWERFGNVRTYVEPFAGSCAVMLRRELELEALGVEWRPGQTIETANDADPYVTNFWRATARQSDRVAVMADWPVNEADLHARHQWLVDQADFRERMFSDPEYFDSKIAAWWAWGLSCWIGSGWCQWERGAKGGLRADGSTQRRRPSSGGQGVHRQRPRVHALGGMGLHGHKVANKRPHLSGAGGGIGLHSTNRRSALVPWFRALRDRLRPVRFCCGDFERVCGNSVVLTDAGFSGLFLDPPYPSNADRQSEIYSVDCGEVAHRAHAVALEWGKHPRVRVAFCGYEGSHEFPDDWDEVAWSSSGGYGGGQGGRGEKNRHRERVWFSPACLAPELQLSL